MWAAVRAGVGAATEGNKERVGGLMYIMTGSVQCNGAKDATADRVMLGRGRAQPCSLDAEQIWFQLCLAPGALVTLDHTELRYRMVYRPLNKAVSGRRGGQGEGKNGRRAFEVQEVHDGSVFLSGSAWGEVKGRSQPQLATPAAH